MKKYLFIIITLLTSLVASSCQDEDFGFTEQEVFQGAYKRNFEKEYGKIAPDQCWDLSSYAQHILTRVIAPTQNGYYYVENGTISEINTILKNNTDNSSKGKTFGIYMGNEEFEIIPVYQGICDNDWTLHMVLATEEGYQDITLWEKSEKIQVIGGTNSCSNCDGYGATKNGSGDKVSCTRCDGKGYIYEAPSKSAKSVQCPTCKSTNKISVPCPNPDCDENGKETCSKCNGLGYVPNGNKYYTCNGCGGLGWIPFSGIPWSGLRGKGRVSCKTCGGDHKIEVPCTLCGGKTLYKCPICDTNKVAYKCSSCNGYGFVNDNEWHNIKGNEENTVEARYIRSLPVNSKNEEILGEANTFGCIVYFYIDVNGTKRTSLNGGIKSFNCSTPSNLQGYDVQLIGCEVGIGSGNETKDYNDLAFLLVSKSLNNVQLGMTPTTKIPTTIMKRYMIEDMGSITDWDFNDIVIDATKTTNTELVSYNNNYKIKKTEGTQNAVIQYLGGMLPIQVTIGNTTLPLIEDPLKPRDTYEKLKGSANDQVPASVKQPGWEVKVMFEISGWNPNENNISVHVDKKGTTEGIWRANFPKNGDTPYIIATDTKVKWIEEGIKNVPDTWWDPNADTTSN